MTNPDFRLWRPLIHIDWHLTDHKKTPSYTYILILIITYFLDILKTLTIETVWNFVSCYVFLQILGKMPIKLGYYFVSILRQFSVILFKFIKQGIFLTPFAIHSWKALDVRITIMWAWRLFGDFWKAQHFNDSVRLKWRLHLKVHRKCLEFRNSCLLNVDI